MQRISKSEGDVVCKIYFSKRKLVLECLEGPRKSKLEVPFPEVQALRLLQEVCMPVLCRHTYLLY